jgi:hypothetical protein
MSKLPYRDSSTESDKQDYDSKETKTFRAYSISNFASSESPE